MQSLFLMSTGATVWPLCGDVCSVALRDEMGFYRHILTGGKVSSLVEPFKKEFDIDVKSAIRRKPMIGVIGGEQTTYLL